ncbi:MAG: DedA family protein [Ktedonobacteraceae bacterium]|nr:DedA family protein [Ktedonobacteraceae bacterium]
MLSIFIPDIHHLLITYGYLAVFIFVAIESTGIPFPGETMLLIAAIYAGTTHQLSLPLVIVTAALGAIVGDNLGFLVGHVWGYRLLSHYGRFIRLDERKLKLGQYLFMKHGSKVVFFGRFVAVLRAWAAFLAGANRMRWSRFLLFNVLGGIMWATLFGSGGYFLGDNIHRVTGPFAIVSVVLGVSVIITYLIFMHRNQKRFMEEAERAFPDPLNTYPPQIKGEQIQRQDRVTTATEEPEKENTHV